MTDYYLSAAGNDSNSGLSASAPWKTITRLNTSLASGIGLNDRVFFNRGDTFYGRIRPPTALNPGSAGWLKFGAYGAGAAPAISGYKLLNIGGGWVQHDADTWKVDFSAANVNTTYTGYDSAQTTGDVGILKVDGVIKAVKRSTLGGLTNQWDFYSSGTTLYVRSSANPTTLAADIRCSTDGDGVWLHSAIELADLEFVGHGGCAVQVGLTGTPTTRGRVLRLTCAEIGGSYLDGYLDGTVRYGNGIQVWTSSTNIFCERNTIRDVYDVAFSIQGGVAATTTTFTDITYRRNLTYRCAQAEEYWYAGTGPGFANCVSEYNTNLFPGHGFGAETRPEQYNRVALLTYGWGDANTADADLTLRRNIYLDCYGSFAYHVHPPTGMSSDRNIILLQAGKKMSYQRSETVEQAAAWATAVGREQNSAIGIISSLDSTDIAGAIAELDGLSLTGQLVGGKVLPIHYPWRT